MMQSHTYSEVNGKGESVAETEPDLSLSNISPSNTKDNN